MPRELPVTNAFFPAKDINHLQDLRCSMLVRWPGMFNHTTVRFHSFLIPPEGLALLRIEQQRHVVSRSRWPGYP